MILPIRDDRNRQIDRNTMGPGKGGSFWQTTSPERKAKSAHRRWLFAFRAPRARFAIGFLLVLLAGCATDTSQIDRTHLSDRTPPPRNQAPGVGYQVHCPDVLQVTIPNRPDLTGRRPIGPDGRIDLGRAGQPRVEGRTVPEVACKLAEEVGVSPRQVHVQVVEFNSQKIYLFGQVSGLQRAVPYQGEETALELLQRVGGITPGAAPDDIYVVRARVAEGEPPEVFHINLHDNVANQDQKTNPRLMPFDQVYVGESRQSSFARCVPPCVRPLYEAVCGLRRRN
jgi:protein involved in polysaccharide export with SLBB domain